MSPVLHNYRDVALFVTWESKYKDIVDRQLCHAILLLNLTQVLN